MRPFKPQKKSLSDELGSSVGHVKAAAAPGRQRRRGVLNAEDLPAPSLLDAFYRVRRDVKRPLPRTPQPVFHQPLPWATEMGPGRVGGGGRRSGEVPPDGVACGKHSDAVVPEHHRMVEVRGQQAQTRAPSAALGSEVIYCHCEHIFISSSGPAQEPRRSTEHPTDPTSASGPSGGHGHSSTHLMISSCCTCVHVCARVWWTNAASTAAGPICELILLVVPPLRPHTHPEASRSWNTGTTRTWSQ